MNESSKLAMNEKIGELTLAHWERFKSPYLLSQLGPDLTTAGINYKEEMLPFRMKQYIAAFMSDAVKMITHPIQKQKTGIIPAGESFEYDRTAPDLFLYHSQWKQPETSDHRFFISNLSNEKVQHFFGLLDGLGSTELDEIKIPLRVMVRMLSK